MAQQNEKFDLNALAHDIKRWGMECGFQEIGITDTDLKREAELLDDWLANGYHGEMDYMARGANNRANPSAMVPNTVRVITVRLNYEAPDAKDAWEVIADNEAAFISRYALGRDYHKVLRTKLQALADKIAAEVGEQFQYRVFTDSAPVMEVALATKAGIGWRGKHTLLLNREAGSMFFLGEIYVNLDLPIDTPTTEHCGTCTKCIDICPTQAIIAPYLVDARRCISYLTIENKGTIPIEFREAIGNRIYGCDDCQLVCPWNKYAELSVEKDFAIRHGLDDISLLALWAWTEDEWLKRMEGSAIRRIGYERWQRNLAVAMGNALRSTTLPKDAREAMTQELRAAVADISTTELVREHVAWALVASDRGIS
jgi:epoxyqueuosine reductase